MLLVDTARAAENSVYHVSRNFRTVANDTFIDKRRSNFIDSKLDVQEDKKEEKIEGTTKNDVRKSLVKSRQ